MKRQALHSTSLTFYHPILEKEMSFTTPIPSDMQAVLRYLKGTKFLCNEEFCSLFLSGIILKFGFHPCAL